MQQEYRIVIRNERYQRVVVFQSIFLAIMAIAFAIIAYYANNVYALIWPILICFSIFIGLFQEDFSRYKIFRRINFLSLSFLWVLIGSLLLLPWWMTLLVTIISVIQFFIRKEYQILLNKQSIEVNARPVKHIEWSSLQNMVIKDELLTIDYRNNHIFQAEIISSLSNIGNEAEFNDFCRLQVEIHGNNQ